jgi:FkbM family methyltransferase
MVSRLERAREILRDEGLRGCVRRARNKLHERPLIDESWYLLNYWLRPSHRCVRTVQGSPMILDLQDVGINRDLFLYGVREPESTKIYRAMLAPGMHVVDIGANIGYYVLIEARALGGSGKIYAIEPAPRNFEQLQRNIELNGLREFIEAHQLAISDRVGTVSFELSRAANHHRLAVQGASANGRTIDVKATTLDALLQDRAVDVVRMDTEGSEWVIVQGMRQLLARDRPLKMFIEVHPRLIGEYHGTLDEWLRILAESRLRVTHVVMWEPESHSVIPYLKGREPREYVVRYDRPLADLLRDDAAREQLLCRSGHAFGAGYKLFVER